MYKQFNKEWRDWINLNIARGCDKNGIYKILIDEGFNATDIEKQMKYTIINENKGKTITNYESKGKDIKKPRKDI